MAFPRFHQHHLLPQLFGTVWTEGVKTALTATTHVLCDNLGVYFTRHHSQNKMFSFMPSFILFLPQDSISSPLPLHPMPSSWGLYQMSVKPCLIYPPRSKCFLFCGLGELCWSVPSSACSLLTYTILLQTWVVWTSRGGHLALTEHPPPPWCLTGCRKYPLSICQVEGVNLWLHGSDLNRHWLGYVWAHSSHTYKHTYTPRI